jgi:hypothetical protein
LTAVNARRFDVRDCKFGVELRLKETRKILSGGHSAQPLAGVAALPK